MFPTKLIVVPVLYLTAYCVNANVRNPNLFLEEVNPESYIRERREINDDSLKYNWGQQFEDYTPFEESYPEQYYRVRRQVFGGVSGLPGGGRTQSFGYQAGPAWGSLSQSFNSKGFGTPITYSGGAGYTSPAGHGLSGSIAAQPGIGGQGNIRGQVGLLNTPNHQVTGWGQHDRNFNRDFKAIGPATNSAGLNYLNKNNGAGAFVSGSHTSGLPNSGSVGGNFPLINKGNTRLDATGQTNFAQGMKPNHQFGLQLNHRF